MATDGDEGVTDQGKLLFGAGFGFGVTVTLLILAVVLAVVTGADGLVGETPVLATVAGGVLFTAVVGVGLFYLAFPANRPTVRIDPAQVGLDDEE